MNTTIAGRTWLMALVIQGLVAGRPAGAADTELQLSTFKADVTIPLGHRCMGILPTKSQEIVDALEARGFVLLGAGQPVVLVAVDWCEIRNGAYDQWRESLAQAAGTSRERVLVCAVHQHDAPVIDRGAQDWLDQVGLVGELYDRQFHEQCVQRLAAALRESLKHARRVTHVGLGQAQVERIASNRRVVDAEGRVNFDRGSSSGGNPVCRDAPDDLIDPYLKTISFWDGETPLVAWHAYATHPMSYYGRGGVSADFVGQARRMRQTDDPAVLQIYASGPSGDVTAGKYNDGSPAHRTALAQRLYQGMKAAWEAMVRRPVQHVDFRLTELDLPFRGGAAYQRQPLTATLQDVQAPVRDRILAAMALSSLDRLERGQKIDLPCLEIATAASRENGPAAGPQTVLIVQFPGESFVGYQLLAQQLRPDAFVLSLGYGECWPGYIPTDAAFADHFTDTWLWVGPHCESRIRAALQRVLQVK